MHSAKWNDRFIALAESIGSWSKDPSTQCGAVIVRPDKTLASVGYNGFPRGVSDVAERYEDREQKYAMVVHAEANAIVNAREPLHECTIFVHPLLPCSACASLIIQSGIRHVVTVRATGERLERWKKSFDVTETMFREAGVGYTYLPDA